MPAFNAGDTDGIMVPIWSVNRVFSIAMNRSFLETQLHFVTCVTVGASYGIVALH